jgi:hypothetical protein
MEQLLQPVVRRDRQPDALPRVAGQLGDRLLAEQPERLRRLLQVAPRGGVGQREQTQHQANHHRIDAGFEKRDPGRHPQQQVDRAIADTPPAYHHHHTQDGKAGPQRGQVEVAAVGQRDDHDPRHVIGEREREQIGAHPVGDTRAHQGQHAQRECSVGRHRRAPAGRRRATGVDGQVDRDRHDHPAHGDHQRQRHPPPLPQLAQVELAARLQPGHQEEERHQPGVHPALPAIGQDRRAGPDQQHGVPGRRIPGRVDVGPGQRRQRGGQQDRRAASLGAQEPAKRRLQPPRPHRAQRKLRHGSGRFGHPRILPHVAPAHDLSAG